MTEYPDPGRQPRAAARVRWLARLGALTIRLLGSTWRIRVVNEGPYRATRNAGRPVVLIFWHGGMLPLLYHHRGRSIAILVSEHADGELIARIAASFRLLLVRGSTSRGAARALVSLGRALESGADIAITPDGPRGPARSVAPGALIAAQRSGVPLVGLSAHASAAWTLRTWDSFAIPKPFARVTVAYANPRDVDATAPREAAERSELVRDAIAEAETLARSGAW